MPRKFMHQCRLCLAKFESNVDFSLQNNGDIVSGTRIRQMILKFTFSQTLLDYFCEPPFFQKIMKASVLQ